MRLKALINIGTGGIDHPEGSEWTEPNEKRAAYLVRRGFAEVVAEQQQNATQEHTAAELIAMLQEDPTKAEEIGIAEVKRKDPRKTVLEAVDKAKAVLAERAKQQAAQGDAQGNDQGDEPNADVDNEPSAEDE